MNYIKLDNPHCVVKCDGTIFGFHKRWNRWIILRHSPISSTNCYETVSIGNKTYRVHQLVALAFLPNPNNLPTVDHKDRDRSNNNVSNLRWANHKTQADNRSTSDLNALRYGIRWCDDEKSYNKAFHKDYYERQKSKGLYFTKRNGKSIWLPVSERKWNR